MERHGRFSRPLSAGGRGRSRRRATHLLERLEGRPAHVERERHQAIRATIALYAAQCRAGLSLFCHRLYVYVNRKHRDRFAIALSCVVLSCCFFDIVL